MYYETESNLVLKREKHVASKLTGELFWFQLPPATKVPRGRPSPRRRAEENEKKEAETGGSG